MNDTQKELSKHYNIELTIPLTAEQRESGMLVLKLDIYRILAAYKLNDSMIEHIAKKALRWTSKGASPKKVYNEIIATAQRALDIIEEDQFKPNATLESIAKGEKSSAHKRFLEKQHLAAITEDVGDTSKFLDDNPIKS